MTELKTELINHAIDQVMYFVVDACRGIINDAKAHKDLHHLYDSGVPIDKLDYAYYYLLLERNDVEASNRLKIELEQLEFICTLSICGIRPRQREPKHIKDILKNIVKKLKKQEDNNDRS